jgi:hypothetical protein
MNHTYSRQSSNVMVSIPAAVLASAANFFFSGPRTRLENMYLYQYIRSLPKASRSFLSGGSSDVWLNFNNFDTEPCWLAGGRDGSCPYSINAEALRQRTVLVSIIAALVVLLLTVSTLFMKCNKNHRNSRRGSEEMVVETMKDCQVEKIDLNLIPCPFWNRPRAMSPFGMS